MARPAARVRRMVGAIQKRKENQSVYASGEKERLAEQLRAGADCVNIRAGADAGIDLSVKLVR